MELSVKGQCCAVLDALMTHRNGFAFKRPVNPVALRIPDYFIVINHSMDLGTIKSKLGAGAYSTPQDFAADVKLTYSNAMLYNPHGSQFHFMAKELECDFLKRWNSLEAKWNGGTVIPQNGCKVLSKQNPHGFAGASGEKNKSSGVQVSSTNILPSSEPAPDLLKQALAPARSVMMERAQAKCDPDPKKTLLKVQTEAQCIEERNYQELMELCRCYTSYDACSGAAVLGGFITGNIVNPLLSFGLRFKEDFIDYAYASLSSDVEE